MKRKIKTKTKKKFVLSKLELNKIKGGEFTDTRVLTIPIEIEENPATS